MLLRAYRLSDKLGSTFLKIAALFSQALLDAAKYATAQTRAWLAAVLALLRAQTARRSRQALQSSVLAGRRTQAAGKRARAATEDAVAAIDPREAQIRALSAFAVLTLAPLLALILWATAPEAPQIGAFTGGQSIFVEPAEAEPTATPVLATPTPLPNPLEVGGSVAYTVRENGQTDIYALVVGQPDPIRLTNSLSDDRDPAWSPDGTRLAYASHRDGNWELYAFDLTTRETTRLTLDLAFQGKPSWSPDGQWLAYESYKDDNLDIYISRVDGSQGPLRLTFDPAPDTEPAWSPDGRYIAYSSWRGSNQEIFVLSLDDPREDLALNLTGTSALNESYPAWSPDGEHIAYSVVDAGLEIVLVKPVSSPNSEPILVGQGREPTWSPNGSSLVYVVEREQRDYLVAGQFRGFGIATQAAAFTASLSDPAWTAAVPPAAFLRAGGLSAAPFVPLYEEDITYEQAEPPYFQLIYLNGVDAPAPYLNDRVDASFRALRVAAQQQTGFDFLGSLGDVWWQLDRPLEPGEPQDSWLMAGRAFSVNRNLIAGNPPPLEIMREDRSARTYWRVFARAERQNGELGEPLRAVPWDFLSRTEIACYDTGGCPRAVIPAGYYVDFTALAADYNWSRVPADRTWRYNYPGALFWLFENREGLAWLDALFEIYGQVELSEALGTPVPRAQPPTITPTPTASPTDIPSTPSRTPAVGETGTPTPES